MCKLVKAMFYLLLPRFLQTSPVAAGVCRLVKSYVLRIFLVYTRSFCLPALSWEVKRGGVEWARNFSCPSTTPVFMAPLLERRIWRLVAAKGVVHLGLSGDWYGCWKWGEESGVGPFFLLSSFDFLGSWVDGAGGEGGRRRKGGGGGGELKQKVGFGGCQRHKKTMWFEVQNTSQQGKAV